MTRMFPANVAPNIVGTIPVLMIAGLILSGCAAYSVVPTEELEAERQERKSLEVEQQQLLQQLENLTGTRTELETQLAVELRKREALEEDLREQESTADALTRLESKWGQWLEQDLQRQEEIERARQERRSAVEMLTRLEAGWDQWREQDSMRRSEASNLQDDDEAKLYLLLLEKKAHVARLTEQLETTIQEVVRTNAKLRSLESKAEAASDLAEAEIAVETLKAQGASWESDPSVIKAEELTELSANEFEVGNYSGALYLTSQAKNVIKSAQARSVHQQFSRMAQGEVAFVLPLSLELLGESAVRAGPGADFKALFVLEEGTALTAYSYLGQWVRVTTEAGDDGWVFYKQLADPD